MHCHGLLKSYTQYALCNTLRDIKFTYYGFRDYLTQYNKYRNVIKSKLLLCVTGMFVGRRTYYVTTEKQATWNQCHCQVHHLATITQLTPLTKGL